MVDLPNALGYPHVRLHSSRPFPRIRTVLGNPGAEETAVNGKWVDGPKDDLFLKLREALQDCRFLPKIAVTSPPEVHALRERLKSPAWLSCNLVSVRWCAHVFAAYIHSHKVVYTGTHDNDTLVGWWQYWRVRARAQVREILLRRVRRRYPSGDDSRRTGSVASISVVPMQDALGLVVKRG